MSEPTNEDRANRIDDTLKHYTKTCKGDSYVDEEDDSADLLTDMMHWCARGGLDFDHLLATARMNYGAEKC